jgi:hypothetical protein
MAKAPVPGKGYLNANQNKQGKQPDYKGHITLSRSYNEGDKFEFGAWSNDYGGFSLLESKPRDNAPQYPRPVSKYNDDDPNSVPF